MVFIAGNVPSSKNSKRICRIKKKDGTETTRLINSATVEKYLKNYGYQWRIPKNKLAFKKAIEGKEKPYRVGFYFIRDSKREFDLINVAQLPCDLMVKYGWIDDDDANNIVPVFLGYEVNKEGAGVEISVL